MPGATFTQTTPARWANSTYWPVPSVSFESRKAWSGALDILREPYSRRNEIALELTQAEADSLKRIADTWGVDEGIAAGRIVMELRKRRFRLPGSKKAVTVAGSQ